jgi:alkylation response protein AidB-like acyl-CoA dehydrogenase
MEFGWSKEQEDLYKKIFTFAKEQLNHSLVTREQTHQFPLKEWRLCGEFGLLGLSVPENYGGIGLDALTTARAVEAFGRGCEDTGLVFSASAHLFACVMPILENASEELKQRVLPKLCSGEWVGANAITEAEAGSDVFAMKATATRDGAHYVINGVKTYVTNGPVADIFLVYASTNPAHGHMGISGFVIDKGTPGLTLGSPFGKMGLTTSPISPIYLDDCRVPAANILGNEGDGGKIFKDSMQWERACLFAGYLGLMDRLVEKSIAYSLERRQFRKPIAKNQAISHRIVDMKLRLESSRLLLYQACWLMSQGKDALMEVSMAKLAISEAAIASSLDAIQIHGGNGFMTEIGIERALRDTIPSTIFSGTSEIQRDLIAKRLGL